MMNCEKFADSVSEYIDGKLPMPRRLGVWMHRAMCSSCRAYMRQMTFVREAAARLRPDEDVDPETLESLAEFYRKENG